MSIPCLGREIRAVLYLDNTSFTLQSKYQCLDVAFTLGVHCIVIRQDRLRPSSCGLCATWY